MSLESIAIALATASGLLAYNGWKLVANENNFLNNLGSFLIVVSFDFILGLVYFSFIVAENVPYNYLVTGLLPVINVTMWIAIIVTTAFFMRIVYLLIDLMKTISISNSRVPEDTSRGKRG